MRISVTMITFNEEDRIVDALKSVAWANEIVLVDAQSSDRTVEMARQFTDRVLINPWPGYARQKDLADRRHRFLKLLLQAGRSLDIRIDDAAAWAGCCRRRDGRIGWASLLNVSFQRLLLWR